jgi:hypothetical protein
MNIGQLSESVSLSGSLSESPRITDSPRPFDAERHQKIMKQCERNPNLRNTIYKKYFDNLEKDA